MTVGILYICTSLYSVFWRDFYLTSEKYLFPNIQKKYFVFTDQHNIYGEMDNANITLVRTLHREWPNNTLLRFAMFFEHRKLYVDCDYLFFYNANTIFTNTIELDEILPNCEDGYLVALCNNDFFSPSTPDEYTYDRNPLSTAFIAFGRGEEYFRGGFNGGRTKEYLHLVDACRMNIQTDLEHGVTALWHDESHLNKYLLDKKCKKVNSMYGKAEEWDKPSNAKVVFRDKNRILGKENIMKMKMSNNYKKYSMHRFLKKILKYIIN